MNAYYKNCLIAQVLFGLGMVCLSGQVVSAQDAAAAKVTFDDNVKPVLRQRCSACHSPDKKSGGLDLTNYTALMQGGGSGASIEPGDPEGSYLFMLVTHEEEPSMPPGGTKIPDPEIDLLKKWIEGGALENQASKASIKKKSFSMAVAANAMERPATIALPPHLPLQPVLHTAKTSCSTALAVSPWAPIAAVAAPKQVLLYNTQSLELVGVLPFPEGIVNVLRFSRDGRLLLAGGGQDAVSGKVIVWDVATGKRQIEVGDELDTVLSADISSDLKWVALGGPQRVVRVYSTRDNSLAYECTKHTDWITALAFSPDSVLLATGDRAGNGYVWEAPTGNEYLALRGHTDQINYIDWRIDSNIVATASQDITVRLWEMENGAQVKSFNAHGGGTTAVVFTRDGNLVTNGRDKVPKLWNQNGEVQKQFPGLPDIGTTIAYCNETGRAIAGDWSGKILVCNAADAAQVGELSVNPPKIEERIAAAQTAVQTATVEHQPVADELTRVTQQMTDLQNQLTAAIANKQQVATEFTGTEKLLAEAQVTLEAKMAQRNQMQAELDEKNKLAPGLTELAEKSAAVAALSPADAELQAAAASYATKLTTTKARIEELTKLVGETTTQTSMTEQEMKAMNERIALQKANMDQMVQQITAMESQMPALQQAVSEKTNLVTQLKAKLDAAQALYNRWQGEFQFVTQLQSLEGKIAEAESVVNAKATARLELEKQLAALKAQVDAAAAEEKGATDQLNAIISEINQLQGIVQ